MYSKSQLASKWFQYFILASNSRGHGIHSPFVYELIREILNDNKQYYAYTLIETARKSLVQDERILILNDLGAGSALKGEIQKKVSEVANNALSTQKFGRLLFRLANFYRAKNIVEMGSSLGISTAYLASADAQCRVTSIEGSSEIANIARETFQKLKLQNIRLVTGSFEIKLPEVLCSTPPPDLIFIDGNHRKKPVLEYFEMCVEKISLSSLIIIHDIHWSREMEDAWDFIQHHPKVKMSIDIFSAGLVFFRDEFRIKQHFTIRF